jgi:hypothetical protein
MDKKVVLPVVGIALLACVALMLTVIGGLYAYNTFIGTSPAVAANTDFTPKWTVTPVTVGGDTQFIVVVTEDENTLGDPGQKMRQMSVYEFRPSGTARSDLHFVSARVLEYDSKVPHLSGEQTNRKGFTPPELKRAWEQRKK